MHWRCRRNVEASSAPAHRAGCFSDRHLKVTGWRTSPDGDSVVVTSSMQEELDRSRAASPRAWALPRGVYGPAALQRIDLIRSHTISPHRRKIAYEVLVGLTAFQLPCAASLYLDYWCARQSKSTMVYGGSAAFAVKAAILNAAWVPRYTVRTAVKEGL